MTASSTRSERRAATRAERRAHRDRGHAAARVAGQRLEKVRGIAFAGVVAVVLLAGGYLAFGDFLGRGDPSAGAISIQASMAGFTPSVLRVKPGEAVTIDFWTQDSPLHLRDGVHTMIGHEIGLHAELPGAAAAGTSRVQVEFIAPTTPGEYDIYCDTCCGGRESPSMHGKVIVEA